MIKWTDYCDRCPRPATETQDYGQGPPRPDKCHYCGPDTYTKVLGAWCNLDHEMAKLRRQIEEKEAAIFYYRKRQGECWDKMRDSCPEGKVRIIDLCGVTVTLDYTGEEFRVLHAKPERNPDA